jgi:hypothetical protein
MPNSYPDLVVRPSTQNDVARVILWSIDACYRKARDGRVGGSRSAGINETVGDPLSESASEFATRRPAAPLRPFVAWYVGYRESGLEPGQHRGLPSPYLTLILTLDDPLVVAAHPDPRTPPGRYDALLGGLHTVPAIIAHDGRQSGIQLALSPLGARLWRRRRAGRRTCTQTMSWGPLVGPCGRRSSRRFDGMSASRCWIAC